MVVLLCLLSQVSNTRRDVAARSRLTERVKERLKEPVVLAGPTEPLSQARDDVATTARGPMTKTLSLPERGRGELKRVVVNNATGTGPLLDNILVQAHRSNESVTESSGAAVSAVGSLNSLASHVRRSRMRRPSSKDPPEAYVQVIPIAEDHELVHAESSLPGLVLEAEQGDRVLTDRSRVLSSNSIFSYKLSEDSESCNPSMMSLPVMRDAEVQVQKELLDSKDAEVETTLVWAVSGFRCTACSKPPLMPGTVLPNPATLRPPRRGRSRSRSESRNNSVDSSRSASPSQCKSSSTPSRTQQQGAPARPSESEDFDGLWVLQTPDPATVADWSRWVYIKGRIGVDARGQRFELREEGMHWVLWKGALSRAGAILHRDGTGGKRMTYMLSPPAPMPADVPEMASRLCSAYNSNVPEQSRTPTS